ncbi:MAG: hypothetical protein U0263_08315 [Polyangiaceae bacterium]
MPAPPPLPESWGTGPPGHPMGVAGSTTLTCTFCFSLQPTPELPSKYFVMNGLASKMGKCPPQEQEHAACSTQRLGPQSRTSATHDLPLASTKSLVLHPNRAESAT